MFGTLIIVFRETIEAGLIVGIVLAATRGVPMRLWWVGLGVAAGLAGACLVALFAGALSAAFAGIGQELFNATILAIAVISITWHNVWMAEHGRELAGEMRQLGLDVSTGREPLRVLAVVVAIAVMREGAEVVLFLYGIVLAGTSTGELLSGGILGLAAGAALSAASYFGLIAIPSRYIFQVTSILLTFLAAGLAAKAAFYLQAAGLVTGLHQRVWDSSWLLSDSSILGQILNVLIGYNDRPSVFEFAVYIATLLTIALLMRTRRSAARKAEA